MSDYRRGLAWKAGVKAQRAGKSKETCNRQQGTILWDDWHDGYHASETGQIPA